MLIAGNSVIEAGSFNYIHDVLDYRSVASGGLRIQRYYRSRGLTEISSFGPGFFSNFDINLQLFEYDGTIDTVYLHDPTGTYPRVLISGSGAQLQDPLPENVYFDHQSRSVHWLSFYDAQNNRTTSTTLAEYAVLLL